MGFIQYLKNCFKRAFLYQCLIVFSIYRLVLAYKFYRDFMRRLHTFTEDLNINNDYYDYLPEDDEDTYKIYMIGLIVLSGLSILGINFIQFITGFFTIITGFIYYNPIGHYREFFKKKFEYNNKFYNDALPSMEFLIFLALGFAMMKNAFDYDDIKIDKVKPKDKEIEMENLKNKEKKVKKE